jgi:hypothetical protein
MGRGRYSRNFRPAYATVLAARARRPSIQKFSPTPSHSSAQARGKLRYTVLASIGWPRAFSVETGHTKKPSPAAGWSTFLESPTTVLLGPSFFEVQAQRFSEFPNQCRLYRRGSPRSLLLIPHPLEDGETSVVKRGAFRYKESNEKNAGGKDSRNFWRGLE